MCVYYIIYNERSQFKWWDLLRFFNIATAYCFGGKDVFVLKNLENNENYYK